MRSLDWQDDAACTLSDAPALSTDYRPDPQEITRLGLMCARCPVQKRCAEEGLSHNYPGFYAGIYLPAAGSHRYVAKAALRRKTGVA